MQKLINVGVLALSLSLILVITKPTNKQIRDSILFHDFGNDALSMALADKGNIVDSGIYINDCFLFKNVYNIDHRKIAVSFLGKTQFLK